MPNLRENPVEFDVLEGEKENIVPLRSGRSALALSKSLSQKTSNMDNANGDATAKQRLEFEKRLLQELEDLDDPLELFLQYITWINNAYPQGGQSKQSGMLEVLERCLMYFRDFATYKNDPRYVKLWISYLNLFAGSPLERQTLYVYMTRKQIGISLAVFYESLCAFLQQQKQYSQARDILKKGIESNARPLARLRKTLQRFDELVHNSKIEIQEIKGGESILDDDLVNVLGKQKAEIQEAGQNVPLARSSSFKYEIFKDINETGLNKNELRSDGWDYFDSKHQRNKENEMSKQLLTSGSNIGSLKQEEPTKASASRLPIFKDAIGRSGPIYKVLEIPGRKSEQIDCNFDLIYPNANEEFCIEERLAMSRNVYHKLRKSKRLPTAENDDHSSHRRETKKLKIPLREKTPSTLTPVAALQEIEIPTQQHSSVDYRAIERTSILPLKDEASNTVGSSKTNPPASPTVTFFSKDAINEVYSMFNQNFSLPPSVVDNDDTASKFAMFENFTQEFTRKHMDDLTEIKSKTRLDHGEKTPHKNQSSRSEPSIYKENNTPTYKSKLQEYMTPIQERTESKFNVGLAFDQLNEATTDNKNEAYIANTAESSPFLTQPQSDANAMKALPILISNPLSDNNRRLLLQSVDPPLSSYETFYQYNQPLKMSALLRKIHTVSKNANKNPIVDFKKTNDLYCIRSQLGEGGYATVYLAESSTGSLKALKVEKPASIWEFYILRQVQKRLNGQPVLSSIISVDSLHCFQDESYLVLHYASQGTILDLINLEKERNSGPLDELLVMYFAVELIKILECIHDVGIIHGDLKPDNCMVRFEMGSQSLSDYNANERTGWDQKGVYLIDFGRSFDLTLVPAGAKFKADWKTDQQDCPEMREGRAWTYEADYYGLAGIIHAMLFGSFIETRALPNCQYALTHSFKRYWRQDIWRPLFDMLLNSGSQGQLPITSSLRDHRLSLENALEQSGHRLKAKVLSLESDLTKSRR
ncbi:LAFA_0B01574g1_1 [Lachancea sp. 'fantastica']|nr:LAFA_0B01574g1_1 [Lachancea sp. 'fantastica']